MNHHEVETKVLDVNEAAVRRKIESLGAKQLQDTLLSVDWYRDPRAGADEWYLRVRYSSTGEPEVTWKAKATQMATARSVREISFKTAHADDIAAIFTGIGLELYAHQDKYRTSWQYQDWQFDLDRYPGIPPFIEIEGSSDAHVKAAIVLLALEGHPTYTDGERTLIENTYGKNWYDMRFLHERTD